MLVPVVMVAQKININGLYYYLYPSIKEAEVTSNPEDKYKYDILIIPETVEYEDIIYTVSSIGKEAFKSSYINSIIIPNSVTSIGEDAFYYSGLSSINIPENLTAIRDHAFKGSCLESITIPNNIKYIGIGAFYGCKQLSSLSIGNKVNYIGDFAFDGCIALKTVDIPNSVTYIGSYAFCGCRFFKINLGSSVSYIGEKAFADCSNLDTIILPNSLIHIGLDAFLDVKLTKVISLIENPFDLDDSSSTDHTFSMSGSPTLYVPTGTINKYKKVNGWSKFQRIKEGAESQEEIPSIIPEGNITFDLNEDGVINAADVVKLVNIIMKN